MSKVTKKSAEEAVEAEAVEPVEEESAEAPAEAVEEEVSEEVEESAEEAPAEEEAVEEAAEEVEEAPAESAEEAAEAIKEELKQIEVNLTKKLEQIAKGAVVSKANQEKKAKMAEKSITVKSAEMLVYNKRNGSQVKMGRDKMDMLRKWLHAVARKDLSESRKLYDMIETKLEPMNTTNDGGLVPTILTDVFIQIEDDLAVIRPRATVLDLTNSPGGTFEFNQATGQPKMSWTGENVSKSTTSMTTNSGSLTPYKLAAILGVTMEVLQDASLNLLPMVISEMGRAIVREEEKAFVSGSGSGRPTGINTYTYRTFASGGTLDYLDFTNTYARLGQAYRDRAVWLMNGRTMGYVLGMLDSNNRPIAVDGGVDHLTGRPIRTLLGAPILEQNDIESTSIFFIDLSYYYIGDKMGMTIEQSNEATVGGVSAFENNLTFVKAEKRVDGEMLSTAACVEMTGVLVA